MIKEVIATGRTVDAAIDAGCEQIGIARGEIDFEIIDMPRKGFLGFSQTPAKVRVFKEFPDPVVAPAPAAKSDFSEEKKDYELGNKPEIAKSYITDILKAMKLNEITVSSSVSENTVSLKLEGDVSGAAIGRRGETLDALQYLTGLATNRTEGDYARIVLDSGNYRDKRRNTLEQLAKKLANAVIKTGRSTTLEPMNPYERRIIHSTVSEIEGVTSTSIGDEPNRCVIISGTNPKTAQRPYDNRPRTFSNTNRAPRSNNGPRRDDHRGGGFHRDDRRGGRREKPAPYQESSKREVAPAEAANQPLYGKIEL